MSMWASDFVKITDWVDNSPELGEDASAVATGLTKHEEYPADTSFDITVHASTGTNFSGIVTADAYGIRNGNILITGHNIIIATATGEKTSPSAANHVTAYGIWNEGPLTTENNTIVVTVIGGKTEETETEKTHYIGAEAYGIWNDGTLSTENNTIRVTATGGIGGRFREC